MAELWEGDSDVSAFSLPGDPGTQEASPQVEPDAVEDAPAPEPEGEVEAEGRKRDEHGRFVAAEEPVEEAPVEQTAEERLFAGKYRSAEDLERAYEELQRNEGRLADEVGQLRQWAEQPQFNQQPQQPQFDRAGFESLVDEDPASAMEYAYGSGDEVALRMAANAWEEVSPGAPKLWAQNKSLEMQVQQLHGNFNQSAALQEQQQIHQDVLRAWATFKQSHPEAEELRHKMFELVDGRPGVLSVLTNNDFESKVQVFEDLYDLARARSSATLATAAQAAARSHVEETQRAKEEAIVVSATASVSEAKPSTAEQIGQQWDALEAPFRDGWNV